MKISFIKYSALLVIFCVASCVKKIQPPIREGEPILVVEGLVTTDSAPYQVKLSYTGNFRYANVDSNQHFINDATVIIKDDNGDSTACELISPGIYQSINSSFTGAIGHSYTVEIHLTNGKIFVSSPEKINALAPIDSISIVYDSSFIYDVRPPRLVISVNVRDPVNTENYYRWTAFGYVPRKAWGGPCTFGSPPPSNPFVIACGALCLQYYGYDELNVLSDQFINGQEIVQPVFYSPVYWVGKHYIEIQQMSLTKKLYYFWQQYLEQTNRTGSILDPLPSSLIGNVRNQADSNEVALGYFSASAIITKKIIVVPYSIQLLPIEGIIAEYIPMGDCHDAIPNTLDNDALPADWENAQEIDF